jgi:hypothetical protein
MNRSEGFRIQFFLLEGMHPELRFLAICISTSYDSGKCFFFWMLIKIAGIAPSLTSSFALIPSFR